MLLVLSPSTIDLITMKQPYGLVLKISGKTGAPLLSYHDPIGRFHSITAATEHACNERSEPRPVNTRAQSCLYMGSLETSFVMVLRLPLDRAAAMRERLPYVDPNSQQPMQPIARKKETKLGKDAKKEL